LTQYRSLTSETGNPSSRSGGENFSAIPHGFSRLRHNLDLDCRARLAAGFGRAVTLEPESLATAVAGNAV
jgi:hypothetical protein